MIDKDALLRKVEKQYRELWQSLRTWLDQAPADLMRFAEQLPEIFTMLERENDLRHKREVYLAVARFAQDRTKHSLPACLGAVHALCQEHDARVTQDASVHVEPVVAAVRALIVGLKVHYKKLDTHTYNRCIEIFALKDGLPSVTRIQDSIVYDAVPSDVREERLRGGRTEVSFTLFPRKEV